MSRKASKAKELEELIGEFITIHLKNIKMVEPLPELEAIELSASVAGYLIGATDNFVYLGQVLEEGYDTIVNMEDVGVIMIGANSSEVVMTKTDEDGEMH